MNGVPVLDWPHFLQISTLSNECGTFEAKSLYVDDFDAIGSYAHFFEPMERTTNSIC